MLQSNEQIPQISLPKGGGSIRGIGEKFTANQATGTASLSIPLPTSPGRNGSAPQLTLSYDSGSGNGAYGLGWTLPLPSITRKTLVLPRYDDSRESDVYLISGEEDLVPVWEGYARRRVIGGVAYRITRYRPRIEGMFARLERWINAEDASDVFWRSLSPQNVTSWYGRTAESRIHDPANPQRIFSWLLCETHDDKGDVLVYRYKPEDSSGIDPSLPEERNRSPASRSANRYLKRIQYGNRAPYIPELRSDAPWPSPPGAAGGAEGSQWMFEVVFDYGEHDEAAPGPTTMVREWAVRHDPFSTYRATFEIRTYRLCSRVLLFHHFPEQPDVGDNCLVFATELSHSVAPNEILDPAYSLLLQARQRFYRREPGGRYVSRALPPVNFEYSQPRVDSTLHEADKRSLENLPTGLADEQYQWIDLEGEGVAGILTEQAGSWFFKSNWSPASRCLDNDELATVVRFGPSQPIGSLPSMASAYGAANQQLLSLNGDGYLDLAQFDSSAPGYFERTAEHGWRPFAPFTSFPVCDFTDPNLRFIDLTGNGLLDLLITEGDAFSWHPSLGRAGFGPSYRVETSLDEEKGPRLLFADSTQTVFVADMCGDGLPALVRIHNGEVCYWPNLGYGRFGAKVTMGGAPWFDNSELFDGRRVRLADIDGSGTADLIYFGRLGTQIYFNLSGNAWSGRRELPSFPLVDDLSTGAALDLLGNGTACLVWSTMLPGSARRALKYVSLMGEHKPHLLVGVTNNLGGETRVSYAPSTKFYVADKLARRPWITRLPFVVQLVERVTTLDWVGRNRFQTRYAYHHGYYDGVEREFRGFGMVEQWDTEEYAVLSRGDPITATNVDPTSTVPPVLTRTWFHTGVYPGPGRVARHMAREYWCPPEEGIAATAIPDIVLPSCVWLGDDSRVPHQLTFEEVREAHRSLKGSMLRVEVYGLDGSEESSRPYSVSERNYTIELLQPRGRNPHAVFYTHARETVEFQYERKVYRAADGVLTEKPSSSLEAALRTDPRIRHAMVLEADVFGNALRTVSVGYGRRFRNPDLSRLDQDTQRTSLVTFTVNKVTNIVEEPDAYRLPLQYETQTYELTGVVPVDSGLIRFSDWWRAGRSPLFDASSGIPFEAIDDGTPQRRLIAHVRTLFRPNDLGNSTGDARALLPAGELESLALPGREYRLALTPGLLTSVYTRVHQPLPDAERLVAALADPGPDGGGYVDLNNDGHWWIPATRSFYHPQADAAPLVELSEARRHFYVRRRFEDAYHHHFTVDYQYDLLAVRTRDALENVVTAIHDYRVMQPRLVTDANGNRTEVRFDVLGLTVGTAVMGKSGEQLGDSFATFDPDLTEERTEAFQMAADPSTQAAALLGSATTRFVYDAERFMRSKINHPNDPSCWQPAFVARLAREMHVSDLAAGQASGIQIAFGYSDGFGREIQRKVLAEPGPLTDGGPVIFPRWIGSGWTILNNKGNPVQRYEPFFSPHETQGQRFEFDARVGVSPTLLYDPPGRLVAALYPDHSYEKVTVDPWMRRIWDRNDTTTLVASDDPDVAMLVRRLPESRYLPTWYQARIAGNRGEEERAAAEKAARHADTPSTGHLDALGRVFLTITDNGRDGHDRRQLRRVRLRIDIQGNQREVRDELMRGGNDEGRLVAHYDYDMAGRRLHESSMEAGERWTINDATGNSIRAWDSRGHVFSNAYDQLRRITAKYVRGTDAQDSDPRTLGARRIFEKTEYGESHAAATQLNLRTRVFRVLDCAGVITNAGLDPLNGREQAYDFKGNLLRNSRRLLSDPAALPDWSHAAALDPEAFVASTQFDALNRVRFSVAPHSDREDSRLNVVQPVYNVSNLLQRVDVWLELAAEPTHPLNPQTNPPSPVGVSNIDYDAHGQRLRVDSTNRSTCVYQYDPFTFRLVHLSTRRPSAGISHDTEGLDDDSRAGQRLQDLRYTFDPVGNVTHVHDAAQQTLFFRNRRVDPSKDFTYDALYRLIEGTGREHLGQGGAPTPSSADDAAQTGILSVNADGMFSPNDGNAMGRYVERYSYDGAGNLRAVRHSGGTPARDWSRAYEYREVSLLDRGNPGESSIYSNRLSSTKVSGNPTEHYRYDTTGNVTHMPRLGGGQSQSSMKWDFRGRLWEVGLGGGGAVHYTYDATGQRVRKVWAKSPHTAEERIYLSSFELLRHYRSATDLASATFERQTLRVTDGERLLALVETRTRDERGDDHGPRRLIRYQLADHLGSSILELDEYAHIISYEEYTPYGATSYQAVRSRIELPKRYRFTGKERDTETGFYYYGARYYASWLGRWISCDPAGFVDQLNLYVYARNNPVILIDPGGLQSEDSKEVVIQAQFTGKESVEELHALARQNGVDFTDTPKWIPERKSWYVGDLHQIDADEPDNDDSQDEEEKPPPPPDSDSARMAGQGTQSTYNAAQRAEYEKAIKERSQEAVEKIDELKESRGEGDAVEAWEEAKSASAFREAERDATREKLTPSGKALSEQIDQTKPFEYYADKYSSPPEMRSSIGKGNPPIEPSPQSADAFQVAEDIAKGAGRSRGGFEGFAVRSGRWLGPLGIAVGVGLAAREIYNAPAGQRGRVAAREVGAFGGGLLGAEMGMGAGVAAAGFISGVLMGLGIISGPIGWLAIGLGMIGGFIGAWVFSKLFANVGEGAYQLAR